MWLPDIIFRGAAKISLESYIYMISIYLLHWLDVIGDFSILAVYIFWVSSTVNITRSVLPLSDSCTGSVWVFSYPLILLVVVKGKFSALCKIALDCDPRFSHFFMSFSVSPSHVSKYPLLTAFAHVSCTRINAAACKYFMVFSLPLTWCKWLIWGVGLSRLWRGTLNKPVITYLVSCNITYSYLVTAMVC